MLCVKDTDMPWIKEWLQLMNWVAGQTDRREGHSHEWEQMEDSAMNEIVWASGSWEFFTVKADFQVTYKAAGQ